MAVSITFFATTKRRKPAPAPALLRLLVSFVSIVNYPWLAKATAGFPSSSSFAQRHPVVCDHRLSASPHNPHYCFSTPSTSIQILPAAAALHAAVTETAKLSSLLSTSIMSNKNSHRQLIVETQRGTIQDCQDLHEITLGSLREALKQFSSSSSTARKLSDARVFLSAAMSNMDTCLDGLATSSGPLKPALVDSVVHVYNHISNSLSVLPRLIAQPATTQGSNSKNERILDYPSWIGDAARQFMKNSDRGRAGFDSIDHVEVITVAKDESGNFTTVGEAVKSAPKKSANRTIIYVKEGVYEETVEIPKYKINIVLWGDGMNKTVITGNRSVLDGWTTFRSATVAVAGRGFLARDITFKNTAGPENHQAVALRINADLTAVYRCSMVGNQDTLYVHSYRQFYRECDVYGTVDFIFGNAAAVFQACNLISIKPMPGQSTVLTAQSRKTSDQETGIVIQRSYILPSEELRKSEVGEVRSYLGRPWKNYSRTVVVESYIDGFIDPAGWSEWSDDRGLGTLYYGEFANYGPGSCTDRRVNWPGFHLMGHEEAANFTVSRFITGDQWLQSTSVPYDDGL